jgi:hypothetical protein
MISVDLRKNQLNVVRPMSIANSPSFQSPYIAFHVFQPEDLAKCCVQPLWGTHAPATASESAFSVSSSLLSPTASVVT